MKKRGFTLIELMAVIAILSILVIIVVPNILKTYDKAKVESFKTSVKSISKSIDNYLFKKDLDNFPSEGINVSELDITSKKTYSGKFIKNEQGGIEADFISNGVYCAKGEIENLQIEKDCKSLDATNPVNVVLIVTEQTSNSIKVVGSAVDIESGIVKYEFKINNEEYIDKKDTNNHSFTGLTSGTHTVYLRVTNGKGLTSETNVSVTLTTLTVPVYNINPDGWSISKTVTITYPTRETNFVYSYSIDDGLTWVIVENGLTADVVFNSNGTIIGKVFDGTNTVTGSQTISQIDTSAPVIESVVIEATNVTSAGFTITRTADATDAGSGLALNPYTYQTSMDGRSWKTECTSSNNNCAVNNLIPSTQYFYRMCVIDNINNQSCTSSKTVTTFSAIITFDYKAETQTYTILFNGTYKLEAFGAQGAGPGGKGGYASGNVYLAAGTVIKIDTGGQNGYNGGGTGSYSGGGATTIKSGTTILLSAAGGGGGAAGTAGGSGSGTGGSGSIGTGYNGTTAPSPYTLVNGTAGTTGGGGGSGNKYKNCTGYAQVYNSCKTTQNTCSYGCDSVYDPCATTTITNPRTTSCSICGYYCASGTKVGSQCRKTCTTTYGSSTICNSKCGGSCNGSTCSYTCYIDAECATCYPDTVTCVAGWVDRNCSSCYYGSPNSCVGGYDNGACNAFGSELYNSGNGGSNILHASLTSTLSQNGTNEGNGKALLTYIGF